MWFLQSNYNHLKILTDLTDINEAKIYVVTVRNGYAYIIKQHPFFYRLKPQLYCYLLQTLINKTYSIVIQRNDNVT